MYRVAECRRRRARRTRRLDRRPLCWL